MTGPLLTVLLLALLAVGLFVAGVYLIAGLGGALIVLAMFTMVGALIAARGLFNV